MTIAVPIQWIGALAWGVFTFFQFSYDSHAPKWFGQQERVMDSPSKTTWVIGRARGFSEFAMRVAWFLLHGLMVLSVFFVWRNDEEADINPDFYRAALALYISLVLIEKLWWIFFFGWGDAGPAIWGALVSAFLSLGAAVAYVAIVSKAVADDPATTSAENEYLAAAIVFAPYLIWLLVLNFWTCWWIMYPDSDGRRTAGSSVFSGGPVRFDRGDRETSML